MVHPAGLEPAISWFVARRLSSLATGAWRSQGVSIPYLGLDRATCRAATLCEREYFGAPTRNRTEIASLEGWDFAIKLQGLG